MSESDIDGEVLTGGYLVELDTYYDEVNKFRTDILNLPVNIKDPDEDVLQTVQYDYIRNYFNTVEKKLHDHEEYAEIESLLDIDSFIDSRAAPGTCTKLGTKSSEIKLYV